MRAFEREGRAVPSLAGVDEDAPRSARFGESTAPFLEQGRAQTTLRHELHRLFSAIELRLDTANNQDSDTVAELSILPNRMIARRGEQAISFSWLAGRLGGIVDGSLLVIEWGGIPTKQRGALALKFATSSRESSYRPEARDAASWCWRAGHQDAPTCTTLDLVAASFDNAGMR